jgi:hypothetical protein
MSDPTLDRLKVIRSTFDSSNDAANDLIDKIMNERKQARRKATLISYAKGFAISTTIALTTLVVVKKITA